MQIINAPITPGTQAHNVSRNTRINDPHPLSNTAKGGNKMQIKARNNDIFFFTEQRQLPYGS